MKRESRERGATRYPEALRKELAATVNEVNSRATEKVCTGQTLTEEEEAMFRRRGRALAWALRIESGE